MKVCVYGVWHLGSVTAACLAAADHEVRGLDPSRDTIAALRQGRAPIMEPGLNELIAVALAQRRLAFFDDPREALKDCKVLWVTFDTPVDDDDRADTQYVIERIKEALPWLQDGTVVLISSQLPVGSCRSLEEFASKGAKGRRISFACSPENLRLGKALEVFRDPDRVIVGVRTAEDRKIIAELLAPITNRVEWMSVESAEMTKHAVNAFLAVSVTFANEIASLCEKTGADAKEVERGLKTESRIGPRAYLSPGTAFAGGTLARDVSFLNRIGEDAGLPAPLLGAVKVSNDSHRGWPHRKIEQVVGRVRGSTVCVWGLTYKPGTDTLRRSSSVELCRWLLGQGAKVRAHDPAVNMLPAELSGISVFPTPQEAAEGSDALIVMTGWPEYRRVDLHSVLRVMKQPNVIDPARFLPAEAVGSKAARYFAVGTPGTPAP
jgi:UDPglucose 6-dehydrogenase